MEPELRYFFYDLFFSMFVREPEDAIIDAWRSGLAAVLEYVDDPEVGDGANELLTMLNEDGASGRVRTEFGKLFWHPDSRKVSQSASRYVDGKPLGTYLVDLRTFIEKTPFRKCADYHEPEDTLSFHLDLMRSLIREEIEAPSPEDVARWRTLQNELVNEHMSEWLDDFLAALEKSAAAGVYKAVVRVLRAFFLNDREDLLDAG
jgi:TorA maturation chaperone TorD